MATGEAVSVPSTAGVHGEVFILRPVRKDDGSEKDSRPLIYLFDSQEVTLGRSRLTQIRDIELSRKQVRVAANVSGDCVELTQVNQLQPSFVNGQPLIYPWSKMVTPGDSICLRKNQHEYIVERIAREPTEASVHSLKRRATEAFDLQTPSSPLPNPLESKKRSRSSVVWTPVDLARQLNIFGSSGKITSPGTGK